MNTSAPLPVSLVISTKNEERNLPACLERVCGHFAEILLVDSGSTDRTRDIAGAAGVTVVDFKWDGHFPKKRNWTLRSGRLRQPWVLFLDADELVTADFLDELRRTLPGTKHNGFWIVFDNYFMGRLLRHGDPMRKLCLFRVGSGEYERIEEDHWSRLDMEIHEHPVITGTHGAIDARLVHADQRDFASHIAKHNDYSTWETRRYFALRQGGEEAWSRLNPRQRTKYRNLAKWWLAPAYFLAAYFLRRGFLDGAAGFRLALFKGFYFWQIRLKIAEGQRSGSNP